MNATLDQFCDHMMDDSVRRRRLEAGFAAGEFVRFFNLSARPRLEEIKSLLREIGAGSVTAKNLPGDLRGAHIPRREGGYEIHYLPDDWRGGIEQTLLHETYEIIYEGLGNAYGDSATVSRVCREAQRFAAAVLMQPEPFEAFAIATGLDVVTLQKQFQCSYASVTLRLGEVLSARSLLAVLYQRRERGRPSTWCRAPEASDFRASVVVKTPGFGVRDSRILCGARGTMPRRGSVPYLGSMAAQVALAGGLGYAEMEPDGGRAGDFAMVTKPVMWAARVAKVAVVAVPYRDRHVLSPQLTEISRSRRALVRRSDQVHRHPESHYDGASGRAGDDDHATR